MTCDLAPTRTCRPCDENHRVCAYRLLLDSKSEAQLKRLAWLTEGLPWIVTRRASTRLVAGALSEQKPEPTTQGECWNCSRPMQLFTYLVEFLKLRGAKWPMCQVCR